MAAQSCALKSNHINNGSYFLRLSGARPGTRHWISNAQATQRPSKRSCGRGSRSGIKETWASGSAPGLYPGVKHPLSQASLAPAVERGPSLPRGPHTAVARISRDVPKHCRVLCPRGSPGARPGPFRRAAHLVGTPCSVLGSPAPPSVAAGAQSRHSSLGPAPSQGERQLCRCDSQHSKAQASLSLPLSGHTIPVSAVPRHSGFSSPATPTPE